jgi:hypothetical protein
MKKLAALVAVGLIVAAAPAAAQNYHHHQRHYNQPRHYHGGTHHHYHNHHNRNYGWVGPAIGGAIIGGIIVDQYYRSPPTYYAPPPPTYYAPPPVPYGYREETKWDYYCGCYRTVMVPY